MDVTPEVERIATPAGLHIGVRGQANVGDIHQRQPLAGEPGIDARAQRIGQVEVGANFASAFTSEKTALQRDLVPAVDPPVQLDFA